MRFRTLACAAMLGAILGCENYEDAKSKGEYNVLQVVEHEHRATPVSAVEIIETGGYRVAGFPAGGGSQNVWVLLNPRHPPRYKQVPDVPFKVTREDLERVRRTPDVSQEVLDVLAARAYETGQ